jgi:hypothetical protein
VWAALVAVINGSSACHSSPVGFANPALYRAAGSAYGSTFTDVTSGNNDLIPTNGGLYPAGPGFDMATGLGTPKGGGLASSMCSATLRIATPPAQRTTVGQPAALQMKLTGPASGNITWTASRLPPGLSISSSSGRITGRPRRAGLYSVVVTGISQGAPLRQVVFKWTVIGLPTVSRVSLTGVGTGRPTLSLTVTAGSFAPALKAVAIALPSGLRFAGRRGAVTVTGARGGRAKFSSRIVRGRLQITLASPQQKIVVGIRNGGISTAGGLAGRVRGHRVRSVQVTITATDVARHGSTVRAQVRPA